jgi:hypothetical protein
MRLTIASRRGDRRFGHPCSAALCENTSNLDGKSPSHLVDRTSNFESHHPSFGLQSDFHFSMLTILPSCGLAI